MRWLVTALLGVLGFVGLFYFCAPVRLTVREAFVAARDAFAAAPDPAALEKAAEDLQQERKTALSKRDPVADELAKVPATQAGECWAAIVRTAKSNFQTDGSTKAWLIEIDEAAYACLNAIACSKKANEESVASIRALREDNIVGGVEVILDQDRAKETKCYADVSGVYQARMARSLNGSPEGSRGRAFYIVIEDARGQKVSVPPGAIHAESDAPASGASGTLPIVTWTPTLRAEMDRHEGVFVVAIPKDRAPVWTLGIYLSPVIASDNQTRATSRFAFTMDAENGKIIEPFSQVAWPYSELENARAEVASLRVENAAHERHEQQLNAQNRELATRNEELEKAKLETEVLASYQERLARQNERRGKESPLPEILKALLVGGAGGFGNGFGTAFAHAMGVLL